MFIHKFNLRIRGEIWICISMQNVVNIVAANDYKTSSLGGDVVTPNNGFDKNDNLEEMSSLVDDS